MPDYIQVNDKRLEAKSVLKLKQDKVGAAIEAARTDGADNVFFQIGQREIGKETYVASGKGWDLKGIAPGSTIKFGEQEATVVAADDQVNSAWEGAKKGTKAGALTAGVTVAGVFGLTAIAGDGTVAAIDSALGASKLVPWLVDAGFLASNAASFRAIDHGNKIVKPLAKIAGLGSAVALALGGAETAAPAALMAGGLMGIGAGAGAVYGSLRRPDYKKLEQFADQSINAR